MTIWIGIISYGRNLGCSGRTHFYLVIDFCPISPPPVVNGCFGFIRDVGGVGGGVQSGGVRQILVGDGRILWRKVCWQL